jgi:hypothetical protein
MRKTLTTGGESPPFRKSRRLTPVSILPREAPKAGSGSYGTAPARLSPSNACASSAAAREPPNTPRPPHTATTASARSSTCPRVPPATAVAARLERAEHRSCAHAA